MYAYIRNFFRAAIRRFISLGVARLLGVVAAGILSWLLVALDAPQDLTRESYEIFQKETIYGNLR